MHGFRLAWVAGFILLAVFVFFSSHPEWDQPAAVSSATSESQTVSPAADATGEWSGGDGDAEEHWQKHRGQFPEFRTERNYEDGAADFVRHPPPGTLVKHRGNGDTLFFDPASGDFAVEDDAGRLRTFFRPDSGMRYWNRQ